MVKLKQTEDVELDYNTEVAAMSDELVTKKPKPFDRKPHLHHNFMWLFRTDLQ